MTAIANERKRTPRVVTWGQYNLRWLYHLPVGTRWIINIEKTGNGPLKLKAWKDEEAKGGPQQVIFEAVVSKPRKIEDPLQNCYPALMKLLPRVNKAVAVKAERQHEMLSLKPRLETKDWEWLQPDHNGPWVGMKITRKGDVIVAFGLEKQPKKSSPRMTLVFYYQNTPYPLQVALQELIFAMQKDAALIGC